MEPRRTLAPRSEVDAPSPSPSTTTSATRRFEALLRRNRFLSALDPERLQAMARHATLRRYRKGESIWRAGSTASHFQVVVSGLVKLVAPNPGMRQTLLDVFGPSEALGYWAAIDGSPYIGDATPVTAHVETLLVPADELTRAMRENPDFALAVTHAVLEHTRTLRTKIAVMCAGSVEHRVAMFLLDLKVRFGDEAEDGSVVVPVPLARADLAMAVGATMETVIRVMSRWQKQAVLETRPDGFTLRDERVLEALVEGFGVSALYARDARALSAS